MACFVHAVRTPKTTIQVHACPRNVLAGKKNCPVHGNVDAIIARINTTSMIANLIKKAIILWLKDADVAADGNPEVIKIQQRTLSHAKTANESQGVPALPMVQAAQNHVPVSTVVTPLVLALAQQHRTPRESESESEN